MIAQSEPAFSLTLKKSPITNRKSPIPRATHDFLMPTLEQLRREVYDANIGVYRSGLVSMHSGNVSGIDCKRGVVLIKPSGMDYERMRPADMVVADLEGRKLKGKWNPSVDLPEHLYIYRSEERRVGKECRSR